jgi:hypothetical protein
LLKNQNKNMFNRPKTRKGLTELKTQATNSAKSEIHSRTNPEILKRVQDDKIIIAKDFRA